MYAVKTLDLSVAQADPVNIVPEGKRIVEVFALAVPAGASFKLALGGGPLMSISTPFTMEPRGDDVQNFGLYYQNPFGQPGFTVELVIVYDNALNVVMP